MSQWKIIKDGKVVQEGGTPAPELVNLHSDKIASVMVVKEWMLKDFNEIEREQIRKDIDAGRKG